MMEVGIRELKNGLSRFLKQVQRGETVVVTDRGRPVARIVAAGIPPEMGRLLAEGRATWEGGRFRVPAHVAQLRVGPPLSESIAHDRR